MSPQLRGVADLRALVDLVKDDISAHVDIIVTNVGLASNGVLGPGVHMYM